MRIKYKEAVRIEVKRGKPSSGEKPKKLELEKLYLVEKKSIREIAKILECSKDMIYRSLKEYEINEFLREYEKYLEFEIDPSYYRFTLGLQFRF